MNAPVSQAFASILNNICAPAPQQPLVDGTCLCTVNYDGLLLDVYATEDGYSGIALKGSKVAVNIVMSDERIDEIERLAEEEMAAA